MVPSFPFTALVGHELLRRALLLGVIHPGLGGVLLRGTKGVAKSTAVRALAGLLPPIETVAGCPFQRRPGEALPGWPLPPDATVVTRPVPLVELPLGATEDRVLGSLHLERALRGERAFEPGLLAAANRGILYIDEVNLLPDHLVDVLLDAAAGGVHRVEREGLSLTHPAHFLLVGTMNPEEGELRPQLLDRFGLVAEAADLADAEERALAVRRRMDYEADPAAFNARWQESEAAEAGRVLQARVLLPQVRVCDELLRDISARCLAAGVEGLRADLTVCRAASAWAAYQGQTLVSAADVDAVLELALSHRRTTPPDPPAGHRPLDGGARRPQGNGSGDERRATGRSTSQVLPSAGLFAPRIEPASRPLRFSEAAGRRRLASGPLPGAVRGVLRDFKAGDVVSWAATLRAAALNEGGRDGGAVVLGPADLRGWQRRRSAGCLLFFVLDTSGSMAAWQRMRLTKAAVQALLVRAYQRRDQVAMLAFHGTGAELVLPPARGLGRAREALEALPVGGLTPLAHGLEAARRLLVGQQRRQPGLPVWTVLLTDGRGNVACVSSDPWHDTVRQARALAALGGERLVINTETGRPRLGRAEELARLLGAACLPLEDVLGRPLPDPWRRRQTA